MAAMPPRVPTCLALHHWVKVELLVVLPSHAQLHLATLLLSSALLLSSHAFLPLPSHAVLHIAGGATNLPAIALYRRLGFTPIERAWVEQPNRDVWVLLDCRRKLMHMNWARVLGDDWDLPPASSTALPTPSPPSPSPPPLHLPLSPAPTAPQLMSGT